MAALDGSCDGSLDGNSGTKLLVVARKHHIIDNDPASTCIVISADNIVMSVDTMTYVLACYGHLFSPSSVPSRPAQPAGCLPSAIPMSRRSAIAKSGHTQRSSPPRTPSRGRPANHRGASPTCKVALQSCTVSSLTRCRPLAIGSAPTAYDAA
jgi:hypothetical protein